MQVGSFVGTLEAGKQYDNIITNSISSYWGCMFAQGKEALLEGIFKSLKNDQILSRPINKWAAIWMAVRNRAGMLKHNPIQAFIDEYVTEPTPWKREHVVTVVNYNTKEEEYFSSNEHDLATMKLAILASGNMPLVWGPVWINGQPYYDGGERTNAPLGEAIKRWAPDHITIINCSAHKGYPDYGWIKKLKKSKFKSGTVGERTLEILLNQLLRDDIKPFLQINHNVKEAEGKATLTHMDTGKPLKYFDHVIIEPLRSLGMKMDFERPELFDEGRNLAKAILA